MQVAVYSQCDSVRLELNGKEIATKQVNGGRLTARFEVPYAAGELKAVGLKNGKKAATKVLRTVGPAKKIRLTVDRSTIRADRNDLAYVTVEIIDASGNLLPDATNLVRSGLKRPGRTGRRRARRPERAGEFPPTPAHGLPSRTLPGDCASPRAGRQTQPPRRGGRPPTRDHCRRDPLRRGF